ncbi:MAG: hypothetical protein KGJ23_16485, partial [Euryarchaeota archaeon]|nr:hypothetical protein [Euryarchaeota archaeon]
MPLGGVAAGIVLLLLGTFLSTFGPSLSDFGHGVRAPSGGPLRGSEAAPAETAWTAGGNLPHQPAPTTPVANRSSVDLGQAVNFSVNPNGGIPPYTYSWYGLPLPCNSTSAPVVACSPTVAANYQVYANVSDSFAVNGTSPTLPFTVFSDPGISVAANVTSLELGRSVAFTATATGGTGSYVSYSWVPSVPQLGCPSSSGPTVVCTPTSSGSGWTIAASVSDSNGITSTPSSSPAIQVVGPLSVGAPTSNRSGADRGQSVQFAVVASGGSAPYSFSWNGLPSGCVTANVSTLPCVLTGAGTSSITVTVRDASGVVASSPALPFIVAIDPTVGSPTASPPLVDQGGSSTLAVAAAGGTGTLLYLWQGLPSSCPSRQATLLCTFSSLGAWTVNVTVTDAAGYSVVSSPLTLLAVALPTVNVSASKVLIDLGQSLTFLTLVHGGVPNFTYSWSGLPCGGTLVGASTITCVPTATGAYNVSVSIVDATGAAATSRPVELSVAVPPSITGFNATSYQVPVGGTSTFTVAAQGGAGPLHYTYSGLPRGCTTQNSASLTCVFQHQGN